MFERLAAIVTVVLIVAIVGTWWFVHSLLSSFGGHAELLFSYDIDATVTVDYRGQKLSSRQFTHCEVKKISGGIDRPGTGIGAAGKGHKPFFLLPDGSAGIVSFNACPWKSAPPADGQTYILKVHDGREALPSATPPNTAWTWGDFTWLDNAIAPRFVKFGGLNAMADGQVDDFSNLEITARRAGASFTGPDLHTQIPYFRTLDALPRSTPEDFHGDSEASTLIVFGLAAEQQINGNCAQAGDDPTAWIVVEAQRCGAGEARRLMPEPGPEPAQLRLRAVDEVPYNWGVLASSLPGNRVATKFGTRLDWTESVCFDEICRDVAIRDDHNTFLAFHQFSTDRLITLGIGTARLGEIIRSDVTGW